MTRKKSTPPSGSAGKKKSAATKPAAKRATKSSTPSKAAGKPTAKAPAPSKPAGKSAAKMAAKTAASKAAQSRSNHITQKENIGKVYRGQTKYIDPEPKLKRDYVVVKEKGDCVTVAKLKTIKKFDANDGNADEHLVEINHTAYGLDKRTGVDSEVFRTNRMSKKPLRLTDEDVFPEGKERFKLGSHDTHRVLVHTKMVSQPKKKR